LNIDDNAVESFESGTGMGTHFDISQIRTWHDAQRALYDPDRIVQPDILLIDISFDRDAAIIGASIPNLARPIIPIGATLALPFLNSRPVVGYSPYSAHITNPALHSYAPFLIAMGLIIAKTSGGIMKSQHLSQSKESENLDKTLIGMTGQSNVAAALSDGLAEYRDNLHCAILDGRVAVLNGEEILRRLQPIKKAIERGDRNLPDVEDDMALELSSAHSNDKIRLASICADFLRWRKRRATPDWVVKVEEWLTQLPTSAYTRAIAVIRFQNKEESASERAREGRAVPDSSRPRTDQVIQRLFPSISMEDKREVFRLCVLFANAYALATEGGRQLKPGIVYRRLGSAVSQNIYASWFGLRTKRKGGAVVCRESISIQPLAPFTKNTALKPIETCTLTENAEVSGDDERLIRQYLQDMHEHSEILKWTRPYSVRRS
jgi:hypothetical protein